MCSQLCLSNIEDFPFLHQNNLRTRWLACCNRAFHALAKVTVKDHRMSRTELQLLDTPQVPPSKVVLDSGTSCSALRDENNSFLTAEGEQLSQECCLTPAANISPCRKLTLGHPGAAQPGKVPPPCPAPELCTGFSSAKMLLPLRVCVCGSLPSDVNTKACGAVGDM